MQARTRPEFGMLYAVANGGMRNIITATRLKAEGVRAGVPDLCLPVARQGWHALYIELKAPKVPGSTKRAGRLSPAQVYWGRRLVQAGNMWIVAHGWEEAREAIETYLR
jgi:hypothetical protein